MDIDERQSNASPEKWKAFHFSTLVVCVLGVIGNVSSLVVLKRHLKEIAGSRLLLALAVADFGVVSAIAFRTLSYVTYGNSQLTQILEWWFLYCYYCSIYLTILLSLDRYLHTAKSMLLRTINYKKILKRTILAVFAVMLLISLPHLLGTCVRYFYGTNLVRIRACAKDQNFTLQHLCNLSSSHWEVQVCGDTVFPDRNVSYSGLGEYQAVVDTMCSQFTNRTFCGWDCECQLVSVSSVKFRAPYFAEIDYDVRQVRRKIPKNSLRVCSFDMKTMRYDPDFVKAVYLGIDLPLRYAIPCLILFVLNVCLVVSVRKANQRHSEITKTAKTSLFNLPVLRSVVGIVFVFLGCHTGGIGLFIVDVYRVFEESHGTGLGTTVNVFLGEDRATRGIEMKGSAFLLAAVNSAINILLYCFFLPAFRQKWVPFFALDWKLRSASGRDVQDLIPMEEVRKYIVWMR